MPKDKKRKMMDDPYNSDSGYDLDDNVEAEDKGDEERKIAAEEEVCPITWAPIKHVVETHKGDHGHKYEQNALGRALARQEEPRSPLTNRPINPLEVFSEEDWNSYRRGFKVCFGLRRDGRVFNKFGVPVESESETDAHYYDIFSWSNPKQEASDADHVPHGLYDEQQRDDDPVPDANDNEPRSPRNGSPR